MEDHQLLNLYVSHNSESAFLKLYNRHSKMVYATAYLITKNHALASDISQSVFIMLTQKASKLNSNVILVGWLFNATRFASLSALREKGIRSKYEKQIEVHRQEIHQINEKKKDWLEIEPYLNEALESLKEKERSAVLMHYYEKRSSQEIADELKMKAPAVRKMISRSLKSMSEKFKKEGVIISSATLGILLQENSICAMSAKIAAKETVSGVLKYDQGPYISSKVISFAEKGLEVMFYKKLKTVLTYCASILALASSALLSAIEFSIPGNIDHKQSTNTKSNNTENHSFRYLTKNEYLELLNKSKLTNTNWKNKIIQNYDFSGSLESFIYSFTSSKQIEVIWGCDDKIKKLKVLITKKNKSINEILKSTLEKYNLNFYFKYGKMYINHQILESLMGKNVVNINKKTSLSKEANSSLEDILKELNNLLDIEILLDSELMKKDHGINLIIKNAIMSVDIPLKYILNWIEKDIEGVEWKIYKDKIYFLKINSQLHKKVTSFWKSYLSKQTLNVSHPGGIGLSHFWNQFYQFTNIEVKFERRNYLEQYFSEALVIPPFELENISYEELLNFICQRSKLNWKQYNNQIILSYNKETLFELSENIGLYKKMNDYLTILKKVRPVKSKSNALKLNEHLMRIQVETGLIIQLDHDLNLEILEKEIYIEEKPMTYAKYLSLICDYFKPDTDICILIIQSSFYLKSSKNFDKFDEFINEYISKNLQKFL